MADFPGYRALPPGGTIGAHNWQSVGPNISAGSTLGSGAWPAANLAIYIPFFVDTAVVAVKMTWANVATVNGTMDVGIYDQYGSLLVNKTSFSQSGTSAIQTADITDTLLNPGNYYIAICSTSSTGTYQRWAPSAVHCEAAGIKQEDRGGSAPTLAAAATFALPTNAYVPGIVIDTNTAP